MLKYDKRCETLTFQTDFSLGKMSILVFWGIEHDKNSKNKKRKVGFGSIHAIYGIKVANLEKMKKIHFFCVVNVWTRVEKTPDHIPPNPTSCFVIWVSSVKQM